MLVELRKHVGRNMATGREESAGQYRVFVDGKPVGFMGWSANSKLMIVTRMGPIESQEVQRQVSGLMKRTVECRTLPNVPVEMIQINEQEADDPHDDFDQTGIT